MPYSNEDTFVHVQATLWKAENSPTGDLPIGEHYFPFTFQLPQNSISSFEGRFGQIRYELAAKIVQSGFLKFNHASGKALLNLKGTAPTPDILRRHSEPATVNKTKQLQFLFFKFGSISATANVSHTGFSPGETLPISVNISNQSSRQVRVASILHRREIFTAAGGKKRAWLHRTALTLSSPIMPGMVTNYEDRNLIIPTDTVTTIRECSCISVEYMLDVIIKIPWSSNKKLRLPIVIADSSVVGPPTSHPQQAVDYHVPQSSLSLMPSPEPPSYNQAIANYF